MTNVGLPDYPCAEWITEAEIAAGGCPDALLESALVTDAITAATEWLYGKSHKRFTGVCESVVRPCVGSCDHPVGSCFCESGKVLVLPFGPISGTPTVTHRGTAITDFFVLPPNMLVRTDDVAWPLCNTISDTSEALIVTYQHGTAPTQLAKFAAIDLAIELLKSFHGEKCSLPAGTTQVNRRGVTIQIEKESVGMLPRVTMFLASVGGKSRTVRRADRPRGAVTTPPATP